MEGRDALALLHHRGSTIARPHPHEQVKVIGLDSQRQDGPSTLSTLAFDQLSAACRYWPQQHRLAAAWAPDEVGDNQVGALLVARVLLWLLHGPILLQNKPHSKG